MDARKSGASQESVRYSSDSAVRRIRLGAAGLEASCLGFGCASLGSRVGRKEGIIALEKAFERGVTWFDLAPAYGRGQAEVIAADFLKGRRDRVQVATKVGLAPPKSRPLVDHFMPLARWMMEAAPQLRQLVRRSGLQANRRLPLTPQLVQRSIEASLRRLRTDHVDLLGIHNAAPEDLARDELKRAFEDLVTAGKARAIAVAGGEEAACFALTREAVVPVSVIQIPLPPPGAPVTILRRARAVDAGLIVHSVFGIPGGEGPQLSRLATDVSLRDQAADAVGTDDPRLALGRLRLARAFALVPDGIVLASMFSERSRQENLALATTPRTAAATAILDHLEGSVLAVSGQLPEGHGRRAPAAKGRRARAKKSGAA